MLSPFLTAVKSWIAEYLAAVTVAEGDAAAFKAWLAKDYEPLSGGWQY
jgi:hypothetical protein